MEARKSLGAGVKGGCQEPHDVGAGKQAWVPQKSGWRSQLLSHAPR